MSFNLDEQQYEIKDELKIRGILESRTDWSYEFTKNSKYDYDLQLFRWNRPPEGPEDRILAGYVEIERTNKRSDWQSGDIPDYWPELRFLRRKIDDGHPPTWGGPKEDFDKTLYLKFNYEIDNCFVAAISDIREHGETTQWPDNEPETRKNTYYALPKDSEVISFGIDTAILHIQKYLGSTADDRQNKHHTAYANNEQSALGEFET